MEDIVNGHCKSGLRKIERRPSKNNIVEEMKRKRKNAVILEESPVKSSPESPTIKERRNNKQERTGRKPPNISINTTNEDEVVLRRKNISTLRQSQGTTRSLRDKYGSSLEFLNLTLTELSHIRSELTRAGMEDRDLPPGLHSHVMQAVKLSREYLQQPFYFYFGQTYQNLVLNASGMLFNGHHNPPISLLN